MRKRWLPWVVVAVVVLGVVAWAVWPKPVHYTTHDERLSIGDVTLDTRLYVPKESGPHPAVLLAHGFGGTKESVASDAKDLADRGYAVLTWTARGFGLSTGQIYLDSPDHEVRDAQGLLDWLAKRPEIQLDKEGDPRVGVVGGSYGGALALLLAAQDQRVDAIVPMITWNDLGESLFPGGVFKRSWAGLFFSQGMSRFGGNPQCGRWAKEVCDTYLRVAENGRLDDAARALLANRSPARVLGDIKAPTLLIQGEADSLFPLSEADANARGITNAPVRVAWYTGGHDGGLGPTSDQNRLKFLTVQWLDHYLKGLNQDPGTSFTYSRIAGLDPVEQGRLATGFKLDGYPGLGGDKTVELNLNGRPQEVANPPQGNPAAITSLPGAGTLGALANSFGGDLLGQSAAWTTPAVNENLNVVGAPTVRIRAASPTGDAVLFVKLYDLDQNNQATLTNGLIAPIRLSGLPPAIEQAQPVTVTLPAIVRNVEPGHRLRVVIATADQGYLGPPAPAVYTVLADGALSLPTVPAIPIPTTDLLWLYTLIGLLALLLAGTVAGIVIARRRLRRRDRAVVAEYRDVPLYVKNLRKTYGTFVAVESIDFTVQRGQVVGMLGPNGAGKTTSLRVLMGLTRATAGDVLIFGHPLVPGSPVLSRIGSLVEGPGFLPHLTGERNLQAYWRASGRPWADAHFEEAMQIAGLGDAIHRRVKEYSHGMKQRLAVAQAMLGLPELLVLDEPTDGLDPPQIAEMRRVLQRYATDGRAVLVSSHLLAEVEQTCTHVVVMHKGVVVASGTVQEIVGDTPTTVFEVSDVDLAQKTLDRFAGVTYAPDGDRTLIVDLGEVPRAEAVAALVRAGVAIDRVTPRRRLEDAFLALVGTSTAGGGDR
jgi:ABC-2 type transport system ATP-binding protein